MACAVIIHKHSSPIKDGNLSRTRRNPLCPTTPNINERMEQQPPPPKNLTCLLIILRKFIYPLEAIFYSLPIKEYLIKELIFIKCRNKFIILIGIVLIKHEVDVEKRIS